MEPAELAELLPGPNDAHIEPAPGPRASSMTFFATRGAEHWVVRARSGSLPPKRDPARELIVLRGLEGAGIAPRPVELLPGERGLIVERIDGAPATVEQTLDGLVALHGIDHRIEPRGADGSIERQLSRLTRRLDDVLERGKKVVGGKRKRVLRPLVETGRWLRARLPAIQEPVLCHGDPQPSNALASRGGVRFVDWEVWSVGDPFTDLAWLTLWAPESDDPPDPVMPAAVEPGLRARLIETYCERTGRSLKDDAFYAVFARWRRAIALEEWYVERLHGNDDPALAPLEPFVPALAERARSLAR